MITLLGSSRVLLALGVGVASLATVGAAQQDDAILAHRALAARPELQALASRLQQKSGSDPAAQSLLRHVQSRLTEGDFRQGDLILLEVQGEKELTDTFVVGTERSLALPSPTVGHLSLQGVLRAELEPQLAAYVGRFVHRPTVRAWPLVRLSVQGEVVRAGIYGVPAQAVLADALMAAGGTTTAADMDKTRIERDGKSLLKGRDLERAIAEGRTLDDAGLRDGDQILVGHRRVGGFETNLRFLWVVVSLVGGVYGLSRAF